MAITKVSLGKRTAWDAVITKDPSECVLSVNRNDKGYRFVPVTVTYPDGSTEESESMLYEASRLANVEKFVVGSKISVLVQLDGKGAGLSQIQLPQRHRLNVSLATNVWEDFMEVEQDEEFPFDITTKESV